MIWDCEWIPFVCNAFHRFYKNNIIYTQHINHAKLKFNR